MHQQHYSAANTTDAFQQGIARNNDAIFHNNDSLNAPSLAGGAKHHYHLGVGGGSISSIIATKSLHITCL